MNRNIALHYIIAIVALLVALVAVYKIYDNPNNAKSLIITILGCSLVAVGQFIVIKRKKNQLHRK